MSSTDAVMGAFDSWYAGLAPLKKYDGRPAKGAVAAALVVLERLRDKCDLSAAAHLARGGAQIAGLTSTALAKILSRFGELRPFPSEAGRTNRGNPKVVSQLLTALKNAGLDKCGKKQREKLIDEMQRRLAASLDAYYRLERLRFDFDPARSPVQVIADILSVAQERGQGGPVAQHLVGAKLALRFPDLEAANFPYSAADDQAGRAGDFQVGNTACHVTVAPNRNHVVRCARNIADGLDALFLAPADKLEYARVLIMEEGIAEKVALIAIESFVGQNLAELAQFDRAAFARQLAALLKEYNMRVTVERDESLCINVPAAIQRQDG